LGSPAPRFALPGPATGATVGLDLAGQGVAMVAISSNDVVAYPQDGPDQMAVAALANGWAFPYLYDETQDIARAYSAACTPDAFVFDGERRLIYRGRCGTRRPSRRRRSTTVDRMRHQVALSGSMSSRNFAAG
jgi:hypothetical protein